MNVLFLTSTLPRFAGDQQAPFVLEQARAWKAKRPGDRIVILAPHDPAAARRETMDGVEIRRFRYFVPARLQALAYPAILPNLKRNPWLAAQILPFLWAEYAAARRIVREQRIDLVYAHWVMPQGLVARRLHRACGVDYAIQNHSSDLSVFGALGAAGRAMARAIIADARHMFCVNRRQKDDALELFPAAMRAAMAPKISVLPMGVGMDIPPCSPGAAAPRYGFAAISRLSRKKGIDLFIAAAERLAANGRAVPIAIAGDGEDRRALMSLPRKADVTFTGFLSGAGKTALFRDARHMVFPSVAAGTDVEGLPVALLEALCCGKTVIAGQATNVTLLDEWPRICEDVVVLDDPRDTETFARALETLLDLDAAALAARSARLARVMARYRWENLIEEYLAAIGTNARHCEPEGQPAWSLS